MPSQRPNITLPPQISLSLSNIILDSLINFQRQSMQAHPLGFPGATVSELREHITTTYPQYEADSGETFEMSLMNELSRGAAKGFWQLIVPSGNDSGGEVRFRVTQEDMRSEKIRVFRRASDKSLRARGIVGTGSLRRQEEEGERMADGVRNLKIGGEEEGRSSQ